MTTKLVGWVGGKEVGRWGGASKSAQKSPQLTINDGWWVDRKHVSTTSRVPYLIEKT